MSAKDRFQDNSSGIISDSQNNKQWLPKDSWQDLGVWRNWGEATEYARLMNQVYAGGHSDWHLPSREEALSLYNKEFSSKDWEEQEIHIHTVFVPMGSFKIWTSEVNDNGEVLVVCLRDGSTEFVDKGAQEHLAARLVRDA